MDIKILKNMFNPEKYSLEDTSIHKFAFHEEKFYKQHFSSLYTEEHYLVYEELRNEMIDEDINGIYKNYWENV